MTGPETGMEHRDCQNELGAYALGALGGDERKRVESHVGRCARCADDLAALRVVVEALPATAPQVDPPPALKDRLMGIVRAEAELLRAAGAEADRPPARRRALRGLSGRRIVAAAAGAALVVGVVAVGVTRNEGEGDASRTVAATVVGPGIPASARVALRVHSGHGTLLVKGLPSPPARRVYQVWLKRRGRAPEPAGVTFVTRSGAIAIPHYVEGLEAVLVTAEPRGGSLTPTRPPLVVARLA